MGIELVNVGEVRPVRRLRDGSWVPAPGDASALWMGWPFGRRDAVTGKPAKGPIVPVMDVRPAKDATGRLRCYHEYTPAQVASAERLTAALSIRYKLGRAACSWGHADVDPSRKADPGPLWTRGHLPMILDRLGL